MFSDMSIEDINRLRASLGAAPLGQSGMLDKPKAQSNTQFKSLREAEARAKAAQKKTPAKKTKAKRKPVKRQTATQVRAEQEARRKSAIQRRQAEEERARAARQQAQQDTARRQAERAERAARSKEVWAKAAEARKAEREAEAAAGVVKKPKKTSDIQFSQMSNEDINNLRATLGGEKLSEQEANKVREGMLASGQMSKDKPLAAPGTAARKRQEAEDPEGTARRIAERNKARGAVQNKNVMQENASGRPEGVSQWLWDRAMGGNLGINPTLITRNPAVRDALLAAGKGDYVKAIYEKHMDSNASHAIGNGADPSAAWGQANNSTGNDWYKENYGTYSNNTVAGSTGANGGDFTFGGGTEPVGTEEQPYVPPTTPEPPVDQPPPPPPPPPSGGPEEPVGPDPLDLEELGGTEMTTRSGVNSFMGGRNRGLLDPAPTPQVDRVPVDGIMPNGQASNMGSTPWADAYLKAKAVASAPGPVSKLFSKELEGY